MTIRVTGVRDQPCGLVDKGDEASAHLSAAQPGLTEAMCFRGPTSITRREQ